MKARLLPIYAALSLLGMATLTGRKSEYIKSNDYPIDLKGHPVDSIAAAPDNSKTETVIIFESDKNYGLA